MNRRAIIYARAALVAFLSIVGAGYSAAMQIADARLIVDRAAAQIAPIPAALLPPGTPGPPAQRPADGAQRRALAEAAWRSPLDPQLINLVYADDVRAGRSASIVARDASLLSRLGWRYTPAQQNLMMRGVVTGRLAEVVDRVDALLRRQKAMGPSFAVLMTMEAAPEVHDLVVAKLKAKSPWRRDYLSVIDGATSPNILTARVRTMNELLGSAQGMTRDEMAPSLAALVAAGRGRDAYHIWVRKNGSNERVNLIHDPRFRQAAAFANTADLSIPFEWKFGQGLGYTAQPSSSGALISWDRRGVPVFLSQVVPVAPGRGYMLTLRGNSEAGDIGTLLRADLKCGSDVIEPIAREVVAGEARLRFASLPKACDMGALTISGGFEAGRGDASIVLTALELRPLD